MVMKMPWKFKNNDIATGSNYGNCSYQIVFRIATKMFVELLIVVRNTSYDLKDGGDNN